MIQPKRFNLDINVFVKDYGFFSFAKNIGKNVGKNISKKISSKYCQKVLDQAKESSIDAFKTVQKGQFKKAEATDDLIGNKIANRITKVSKTSP